MVNKVKAKKVLVDMLCEIKTQDEMLFILEQVLTKAEIEDLVNRVRIYQELACTEITQRECAKILDVSISKVTRGASNLQNPKIKKYWQSKFKLR
jgi:TrpR family transcriptional regulator, trp operon repressor